MGSLAQIRTARRGTSTWVVAALIFVTLPTLLAQYADDDEDEMESEEPEQQPEHQVPPWNRMTLEEAQEHMTWDEESIEKRREWVTSYRQAFANHLAGRLKLGKGNVFGGYEMVVHLGEEELTTLSGGSQRPEGKKAKKSKNFWRHRCLDANITYDTLDECAVRYLVTLGSICSVQADSDTATPFLKKTIRDHMKVLSGGMVYELGVLRRKMEVGTIWGLSPALVADFMQKEAEMKGKQPVVDAPEFSLHLPIQAAMMYVYFSCATPLNIDSFWETGEELWRGVTAYYNENTWDKVGMPQEQAYHFVRLLGKSLSITKGQSETHFQIQKYMEDYEAFLWKYWQEWMAKNLNQQYNGCESLANGLAWHQIGVGTFSNKEMARTSKWFEDMIVKNFNSIMPSEEAIKEKGLPTLMIQTCGIILFQSAWVKIMKDPGMTVQFFRDIKRSFEASEMTQERWEGTKEFMEGVPNATLFVGGLIVVPQMMFHSQRFSYRLDDMYDCLDALEIAQKILDDPPDNMPLRPNLPSSFPLQKDKKKGKPKPSKQAPQMDLDSLNLDKKKDATPNLDDLKLEAAHIEL